MKLERKLCKFHHKTLGYAEVPIDPPNKFLKKNGGIKCIKPKTARICLCPTKRPPVPRREKGGGAGDNNCSGDGGDKGKKKDFKSENIKRVLSAEPRRPLPRFVDTKNGDKNMVEGSGLMPMHVFSTKFGKIPPYLVKRMRDAANQENVLRDEQARVQPKYRYITQEERGELLCVCC